jgi:hypothetical protein
MCQSQSTTSNSRLDYTACQRGGVYNHHRTLILETKRSKSPYIAEVEGGHGAHD